MAASTAVAVAAGCVVVGAVVDAIVVAVVVVAVPLGPASTLIGRVTLVHVVIVPSVFIVVGLAVRAFVGPWVGSGVVVVGSVVAVVASWLVVFGPQLGKNPHWLPCNGEFSFSLLARLRFAPKFAPEVGGIVAPGSFGERNFSFV